MPRIRSLKPEIVDDEALGSCAPGAQALYTRLLCLADDRDAIRDDPSFLRRRAFPYLRDDLVTASDVAGWLTELKEAALVVPFQERGRSLVRITSQPWLRWNEPVSARLRRLVLARDGTKCRLCGSRIGRDEVPHIDHRIPLAKGGLTVLDNLQVAHAACNVRKGGR